MNKKADVRRSLSATSYLMGATGLAIVCPITNTNRNIPFHVAIPKESSLTGYVMVEQVKSIDTKSRQVKLIEKAPTYILDEVLGILDACIYQDG